MSWVDFGLWYFALLGFAAHAFVVIAILWAGCFWIADAVRAWKARRRGDDGNWPMFV